MHDLHLERLECSICTKTFSNQRNLNRHNQEIHRMHENQVCSKCGKNLSRKEKLEEHEETCHTKTVVMPKQSVKEFPCNYCEKIYTEKDHVQ